MVIMKRVNNKPSSVLVIIQRILIGILVLIFLAILAGTIYAIIAKSGSTEQEAIREAVQMDGRVFTTIGRIRARSAEPNPAAVMITISFPYDIDDVSFSEELASKVEQFRSETIRYFQAYTADELRLKSDAEIQRELLILYNAVLRLGFIDALYITDYMIID